MNPEPSSQSPAAIEDAAIAWLVEREDGFAPEREREFAQWLHADPLHAAAVARLEQTLGLLEEAPEFRAELNTAFDRVPPVVTFPSPWTSARIVWRRRLVALSGVAAACLLVIFLVTRAPGPAPAEAYHASAPSGYERAELDDGSTIELNAASAVRVHYTASERRVEVERGEAHFAVARDEARPFLVSAGGVWVHAIGTAFNVRLAGDTVEVVVSEGKVRVARGDVVAVTADSAPLVVAGERVLIDPEASALVIEKIEPEVLREALAWQGKLVKFADAPLAEIVTRFNARNRLQLVLADTDVGVRRIGGTFALDEVETFVRLLERDGEIVGERRSGTEIVLRSVR